MPRTKTPKTSLDHSGFTTKTSIKVVDEIFEEEPASGNSFSPRLKIALAEEKFKRAYVRCKQPVLNHKPLEEKSELQPITLMNYIQIEAVPQRVLDHFLHQHDPGDDEEEIVEPEVDNDTGEFANGRAESVDELLMVANHNPDADVFICKMKGATIACCADNPVCTVCKCDTRYLADPSEKRF